MEHIHTIHSSLLPFDQLSVTAKTTHILSKLQSASLLSLEQLCDDDCKINLDKKYLHVYKNNQEVLRGYRNQTDGL